MKAYFDKKQRLAEAQAAKEKLNPATSLVSAILPTLKNTPGSTQSNTLSSTPPDVH
jgi:hypothetical protein